MVIVVGLNRTARPSVRSVMNSRSCIFSARLPILSSACMQQIIQRTAKNETYGDVTYVWDEGKEGSEDGFTSLRTVSCPSMIRPYFDWKVANFCSTSVQYSL